MMPKPRPNKNPARLARENAYLKRKLEHLEKQQRIHENINDNLRHLLKRINRDYQDAGTIIERQNLELQRLAEQLNESYAKQLAINDRLRKAIAKRHKAMQELQDRDQQLRRSLEEKEALLREIHHRVKNNLQVVTGLLQISLHQTEEESVRTALSTACTRVQTMAIIHAQLHQGKDFSRIDMSRHALELCRNLTALYGNGRKVDCILEAENVQLPINLAVPLGMVLNELIANSFQHAFTTEKKGWIRIEMRQQDGHRVRVSVTDSGPGLPPDFDINQSKTLGFQLISRIVKEQMKGRVSQTSGSGVEIDFPEALADNSPPDT